MDLIPPQQPDQQRPPSRAAAVVAALLTAVLVGGLFVDVANFEERYVWIPPRPIGDDSVAIADTISRNRVLSYLVGMAAREAAGERLIQALIVPEDLGTLSSAVPDDFLGKPTPALNRKLINPVVRGRLSVRDYDTVLPDEFIERFEREDRLVEFPRGVFAVVPDGESSGRVYVYSDAEKVRLYAVPEELAPL